MLDDLLVENKTEFEPEDELKRFWVSMRDHGCDVVKRRSVILRRGRNVIEIFWKHIPNCTVTEAAVYDDPISGNFLGYGPVSPIHMRPGDTATVVWEVFL